MNKYSNLIQKAIDTHSLSADEIEFLLNDDANNCILFKAADKIREKFVGNNIHLRALIELSNICGQNCLYCGIRADNKGIIRYRLSYNEISSAIKHAAELEYKTIVIQSGETGAVTDKTICRIAETVKNMGMALTLSIGEKTKEQYKLYKDAGADRYLLRIETTDAVLYKTMHPGMQYSNRVRCLYDLKELGYEVGTGNLVGLPGQTNKSLARDILFFKDIDADMIGIGPFIPDPATPLANASGGTFEKALKVMSVTRLLLPDINIPATTAMETLHPDGRIIALQSGANVVMPNLTDTGYKKLYSLYPGKICVNDSADICRSSITEKIQSIGRKISQDCGGRKIFSDD